MIILLTYNIDKKINGVLKNFFINIDKKTFITNINLKQVVNIVQSIHFKQGQTIIVIYEDRRSNSFLTVEFGDKIKNIFNTLL